MEVDYSDLEFDEEKYYLGKLCPRKHNWNETGHSLRKLSCGHCTICIRIQQKKYKENNRKVEVICDECGSKFKRKEYLLKENVRRKQKVFCSLDCKYKFFQDRVEVLCDTCGIVFEKRKSHLRKSNFCSNSCKFAFYVGSKSHFYIDGRWEDSVLQQRKSDRRKWKWYYWKGVVELLEKMDAPDIVVVKALEVMYDNIELALELKRLLKEGKWEEYIMRVRETIRTHGEHLANLINGEVRHPQFRIRQIDRSTRTHVAVLREERKEVVTNAFNHPDQIPALIEL